jgi:hypothetical protein
MNDTPRDPPDIFLFPTWEYNASYNDTTNEIVFETIGFLNEDAAMCLYMHELEHWSQFLFMDHEEIKITLGKYNEVAEYTMPFIERINPYKTAWIHKFIPKDEENL